MSLLSSISRVTYRGAALFAGSFGGLRQMNRVSAFGASGSLTKEDILEIGSKGIVEVVDEEDEYSLTIDSRETGRIDSLISLAGKGSGATSVDFSSDFEYASADIINYIKDGSDKIVATQVLKDSYITGYSANLNAEGESTESLTLASDNKRWYTNGLVYVGYGEMSPAPSPDNTWEYTPSSGTLAPQVISVYADGRSVNFSDTSSSSVVSVELDGDYTSVYCVFATDSSADGVSFTTDTDITTKRRGHIELYLVEGHEPYGKGTGEITGGTIDSSKRLRVQSVALDASLDRENLPQLGSRRYYDRPLTLPINVTVSFDLIYSDLELFAKIAGKNASVDTSFGPDDFKKDIGAILRIYDKTDIEDGRSVVKEVHIPYLIPTDEAFNISLDGNATQTFSFRSHELFMKTL